MPIKNKEFQNTRDIIEVSIKPPENINFTPSESEITEYLSFPAIVRPWVKTKKGFKRMNDKQFANYFKNELQKDDKK